MPVTPSNDQLFCYIKPSLNQAFDVMESLRTDMDDDPRWRPWPAENGRSLREEFLELEYSPYKAVLVEQTLCLWQMVVGRKIPAIWFCRKHRPIALLVMAICELADVPLTRLIRNELTDADMDRLVINGDAFYSSPLWLCDAREPEWFKNALAEMKAHDSVNLGICDWVLEDEELEAARGVADKSGMLFICPKW